MASTKCDTWCIARCHRHQKGGENLMTSSSNGSVLTPEAILRIRFRKHINDRIEAFRRLSFRAGARGYNVDELMEFSGQFQPEKERIVEEATAEFLKTEPRKFVVAKRIEAIWQEIAEENGV